MSPAYAVAIIFGALVGLAELLARYRDAPSTLWSVPSAWFYVAINALASAGALLAIHVFGWSFGGTKPEISQAYQILVAGFGSAALFRSALFLVKPGSTGDLIVSGDLVRVGRRGGLELG